MQASQHLHLKRRIVIEICNASTRPVDAFKDRGLLKCLRVLGFVGGFVWLGMAAKHIILNVLGRQSAFQRIRRARPARREPTYIYIYIYIYIYTHTCMYISDCTM